MTWETIITTLSLNIIPVIAAIITTTGSIISVIYIHNSKVKQELTLRREIELFDRKQKAYRTVLHLISRMTDHSYLIGSEVNWKIIRHVYNEILLVGSSDVVKAANYLLQSNNKSSEKENELIKNLWNTIRTDLYKQNLSLNEMHVISPSQETIDVLNIYNEHLSDFVDRNITTINDLAEINVGETQRLTGMDIGDLTRIKGMAIRELQYEKELKEFREDSDL